MPYAVNGKVKIYYEVAGQGPPIILAHGLSGDTTYWRGYGYVDQLKEEFSVVLFDARGHGKSDAPHETAAYAPQHMVDDVLAVMDALAVNEAHYWGYSMGGSIGFHLASQANPRLISLIAGGTDPYFSAVDAAAPHPLRLIFERGVVNGPEALVVGMRAQSGALSPQYEARLRGLDPRAMVAFLRHAETRPSFHDTLPRIHVPCLLYAGEEDDGCVQSSEKAAGELRNGRFFSLPGLNHAGTSAAADLIMPQVRSFLLSVPE